MIPTNYTHSTSFSGKITPFTKENLLKRAQSPEIATKLKNKSKEIENNTNKNSVIHLARVSDDLFSYYLISKNERYNITKGCTNVNLVKEFLGIATESIKKIEKKLIQYDEL